MFLHNLFHAGKGFFRIDLHFLHIFIQTVQPCNRHGGSCYGRYGHNSCFFIQFPHSLNFFHHTISHTVCFVAGCVKYLLPSVRSGQAVILYCLSYLACAKHVTALPSSMPTHHQYIGKFHTPSYHPIYCRT